MDAGSAVIPEHAAVAQLIGSSSSSDGSNTSSSSAFFNDSSSSEVPIFGHTTPWGAQMGYVFLLYFFVAVLFFSLFLLGRWRALKSARKMNRQSSFVHEPISVDEMYGFPLPSFADREPQGLLGFVPDLLRLSDDQVAERAGLDALTYMKVQKYMLVLLTAFMFYGLLVLLPIYDEAGSQPDFAHTTATNIDPKDKRLIAVLVATYVYSFLVLVFVYFLHRMYRKRLRADPSLSISSFSVTIRGIPTDVTDVNMIRRFVEDALPPDSVVHLALCLDYSGLRALRSQERALVRKWEHWVAVGEQNLGQVKPQRIRCCASPVNPITYYASKLDIVRRDIQAWKALPRIGLGVAFLTLRTVEGAKALIARPSTLRGHLHPDVRVLAAHDWRLEEAPVPHDVLHANVSPSAFWFWVRVVAINVALFVCLFFFTTPISIMGGLNTFGDNKDVLSSASKKLADAFSFLGDSTVVKGYLSSLLMMIFTLTIPRLLIAAAGWEGHETKSGRERSTAKKIFTYLVVATLIMPSVLITSIDLLWKKSLKHGGGGSILKDLGGVFPNALFFINYLMAIAFVGNFLEFLNLPWSVISWWRQRSAVTRREVLRIRNTFHQVFRLGFEYSYCMNLFCITLLYSTVVPILVPFGLAAMATKAFADRHNLLFVYRHDNTDKHLLRTVIGMTLFGLLLYQMAMFGFFYALKGELSLALITSVLLVATVTVAILIATWKPPPEWNPDPQDGSPFGFLPLGDAELPDPAIDDDDDDDGGIFGSARGRKASPYENPLGLDVDGAHIVLEEDDDDDDPLHDTSMLSTPLPPEYIDGEPTYGSLNA